MAVESEEHHATHAATLTEVHCGLMLCLYGLAVLLGRCPIRHYHDGAESFLVHDEHFGIPILLCAFLLRCGFGFGWWVREKVAKRKIERGNPVWGVAILVVLSVVILPIFLTVKPDRIWREWNGRRYRTMVEENIVHVQVRENGKDFDIHTDASAIMRYHLKSISDDELQLKSSDVGCR